MTHFYAHLDFELPRGRPLVACNMVSSLDGKVTAHGKQPRNLGSSFDRQTMQVIRSHFHAVLAGGNTIRQFPLYLGVGPELAQVRESQGLAAQPLTVILTNSGILPEGPLFQNPPRPPIIITSEEGAGSIRPELRDRVQVEILEQAQPQAICTLLMDKYGVQRLLLEGGPSVNYQFMKAKLLDELFVTLSPTLIGRGGELNLAAGEDVLDNPREIRLLSVNQVEQELFLRYRIHWG